jgi:hypothetical protein
LPPGTGPVALVLAVAVALVLALVGFAADTLVTSASASTPSFQVTPTMALHDGEWVTVTGAGLSAASYRVYECLPVYEEPPQLASNCAQLATLVPEHGSGTTLVRVTEDVGPPVAGAFGTIRDTCQAVLLGPPCTVIIGSGFSTDGAGNLVGGEVVASLQFTPAVAPVKAATAPLSDGQVVPLRVSAPGRRAGPIRVAECSSGAVTTCEDVAVPGHASAAGGSSVPIVVAVRVRSHVNGTVCAQAPPTQWCLLVAGTGPIGSPGAAEFGYYPISFGVAQATG